MNKATIQRFAVWARRDLLERVKQRAYQYGITEDGYGEARAVTAAGRALSPDEQTQRKELVEQIRQKGYPQVMEEVAYTWFNRFIALRFMEVNNYLPSHIRVFSDSTGAFKPEILNDVLHLELPGLDKTRVGEYIEKNQREALYRYLLLTQCNALHAALPRMFETMGSYTELLFPNNILRQDSVLGHMVTDIPEGDWTDQVQIIGWLYQYYNSELKDETFALLKKNVKITKERIPSATQLFTPDWIVRYMVENSLGRLWLEHLAASGEGYHYCYDEHGSNVASSVVTPASIQRLKSNWKYYLDEAKQEPEVQAQLAEIRKEYAALTPAQIKCIDPCAGSGHILAYMFDVLVQIYEAYGYTTREAVRSIIENNIYGLDIDDRAAQLAYFAVMMKACQYDRRFLTRKDEDGNLDVPQPHVYAIAESNYVDKFALEYFVGGNAGLKKAMDTIIKELYDAKEYGSILTVTPQDWTALYARFDEIEGDISMYKDAAWTLKPMVQVAQMLSQKYQAVCTNPPYMGSSGMSGKLSEFVKKNYPDSKSDLFAVFIERCGTMTAKDRYQAMITQHAWMFLSSFEKLRAKLQRMETVNMAHLGPRAFEEIGGEVVQTTSFVLRKDHVPGYMGTYCRLIEPTTQQGKEDMFLAGENRYTATQDNFSKIPGSPVAYWVSEHFMSLFEKKTIRDIAFAGIGMRTGDNDRFLRLWYEVNRKKMFTSCADAKEALKLHAKWIPYNKGGEFRRWYGNNEYVVNWENDGKEIKDNTRRVYPQLGDNLGWKITNEQYYFHEGITWTVISSKKTSFRRYYKGAIISNSGQSIISEDSTLLDYLTGLLNTNIVTDILAIISPTIGFESGYINKIPVIFDINQKDTKDTICQLSRECVSLSRSDWDSFETSWDFKRNPLVEYRHSVSKINSPDSWYLKNAYETWEYQCQLRFDKLKSNEEELNRIFTDIYGLQDELTPEVEDKDVTVRKADLGRDIRSLISYAVGCMFGRYCLDADGLVFAGGDFDSVYWRHLGQAALNREGNPILGGYPGISVASYHYPKFHDSDDWESATALTFEPDPDNIIPICDDDYFDDDITGRFVKWVETVYGKNTLEENLKFIADALGGKGTPREVIRGYFLNDFYADHLKIYQKRPIYWLFDSGKKNGFKALIYMHRYQSDLLARMRTDYVHEQQERYRTQLAHIADALEHAAGSERVKLTKQQKKLQEQALEIQKYEEKIHHLADQNISIDLDDGVKHNYALFEDVLAKIK